MPVSGSVTRAKCYPCVARRGPAWTWTYSVTLPGHYELNEEGALHLVSGGTHQVGVDSMDQVRTICRKAGVPVKKEW